MSMSLSLERLWHSVCISCSLICCRASHGCKMKTIRPTTSLHLRIWRPMQSSGEMSHARVLMVMCFAFLCLWALGTMYWQRRLSNRRILLSQLLVSMARGRGKIGLHLKQNRFLCTTLMLWPRTTAQIQLSFRSTWTLQRRPSISGTQSQPEKVLWLMWAIKGM